MNYPNRIFTKIQITLLTIFVVGCTCLPFSSPPSKTPIVGALSYSDILTYIGTNVKSDPKWNGWNGTADESQPLNYSITPASPYVTINQETGEITVLAKELFSNSYIVSVNGYGDFEERVSTTLSVEVKPPFLYNVYNVNDDSNLELSLPFAITTEVVGDTTYLFVAGCSDFGVSVFSVSDDGSLVNITNISDDDTLELAMADVVDTALVGDTTYLFVGGGLDQGVSVFSVGNDGSLINVYNIKDDDNMELRGVLSIVSSKVGGATYLFAGGENGISVFLVGDDGYLSNVYNVVDFNINTLNLEGVWSMNITEIEGTAYLFAAGRFDDGMSVFSINNDGSLNNVYNINDDDDLNLDGVRSGPVTVVGETNYLFVSGWGDSGVSVFSVGNDGSFENVYNVSDDDTLKLSNANSITTPLIDGTTYLLVGGYTEGLSAFSVGNDGSLINIANVGDSDSLELKGILSTTIAKVGETNYLFVAGAMDNGVSVFSINP